MNHCNAITHGLDFGCLDGSKKKSLNDVLESICEKLNVHAIDDMKLTSRFPQRREETRLDWLRRVDHYLANQNTCIEEVNEIPDWLLATPADFRKLWVEQSKNVRAPDANRSRLLMGTWEISHPLPLNQFFNIKSIKSMKNFESLTIGGKIHSVIKKAEHSQPAAPKSYKIKMIREDENTGDIVIECVTDGPMSSQAKFVISREHRKQAQQEDTGIILSTVPTPCANYHKGHVTKYLEYLKGLVIDAQNTLSHETKVWKESKK